MPNQQNILRLLRMLRTSSASCPKVRLGALGDGGYVVNDDLSGLDGLVSLGIGTDVSFDLALAEQGVPVFQYDPTVERPPVEHPRFVFRKLGWSRYDSQGTRSLDTILNENQLAQFSNLILKFDVEDAEWDALQSVSAATLSKFRIIVGEFHWLERVVHRTHFEIMWGTFAKLTADHVPTHLHANNFGGVVLVEGIVVPRLLEITLLRRDRAHFTAASHPIPTALDYRNIPETPELVLTPFE
jgi:hypothetical protein